MTDIVSNRCLHPWWARKWILLSRSSLLWCCLCKKDL